MANLGARDFGFHVQRLWKEFPHKKGPGLQDLIFNEVKECSGMQWKKIVDALIGEKIQPIVSNVRAVKQEVLSKEKKDSDAKTDWIPVDKVVEIEPKLTVQTSRPLAIKEVQKFFTSFINEGLFEKTTEEACSKALTETFKKAGKMDDYGPLVQQCKKIVINYAKLEKGLNHVFSK